MGKNKINFVLIIIFAIGILIGYSLNLNFAKQIPVSEDFSKSEINLVAIDNEGNGVTIPLYVEKRPGEGKVLTNIDKLLFWVDTQYSIQTARSIAEKITKINTTDYDLIYTVQINDTTIIGGPSAGAALTLATIAVLQNKTLKEDVMITGTINEDGTIGQVGAVLEKAEAAKEAGAKLFLVPKGEGTQVSMIPEEKCVEKPEYIYCETTYRKESINIGEEIGVAVLEVGNINDAMKFIIE